MKNLKGQGDAFGVAVGDLVANGSNEHDWKMFLQTAAQATAYMPYYWVPGNHDYDGYYDSLRPVWFDSLFGTGPHHRLWTYANCAFISLDLHADFPVTISPQTSQGKWFLRQIRDPLWELADWRFVFVHHPPYSQGWAGYEGEQSLRRFLESLTEKARIDFIISGHTHDYERLTRTYSSTTTSFIIVGGAGGALEPEASSAKPKMDTVIKAHHVGRFKVNGKRIVFQAVGLSGAVLDSLVRTKS